MKIKDKIEDHKDEEEARHPTHRVARQRRVPHARARAGRQRAVAERDAAVLAALRLLVGPHRQRGARVGRGRVGAGGGGRAAAGRSGRGGGGAPWWGWGAAGRAGPSAADNARGRVRD